jgi:hypothetical protein
MWSGKCAKVGNVNDKNKYPFMCNECKPSDHYRKQIFKQPKFWIEIKSKVNQNTTSFIGVNETTCFYLLGGHHQVCKILRY